MSTIINPGLDSSGNSNNWTVNNANWTDSTSATFDVMSDVPTLTDEDTANFATFNGASVSHGTLTNGNLTFSDSSSGETCRPATIAASSGKFYWEVTLTAFPSSADCYIGIADVATLNTSTDFVGERSDSYSYYQSTTQTNSRKVNGASFTETDTTIGAAGAVIQVALDLDAGKIWFGRNNSYINSGNPSAGTNEAFSSISGTKIPAVTGPGAGVTGTFDINFGQRPFAYTPPTGFKKINTFNLPDSTIEDGSDYFDTVLYTGTGSSLAITGLEFSPDFVWTKGRDVAYSHYLFDSVRGATLRLISNSTGDEAAASGVSSFDANGFTLGTDVGANNSGSTFVGWNWKAGGTAVSNTDGDITSQVSANPTAGFSIATWTNESSGDDTVGHGLGVAPKLIITKLRSTTGDWYTQTTAIDGGLDYLKLNDSNAAASLPKALPTADVFTTDMGGTTTAVAYCFAEVEGYSKIDKYTGNGSADGPFIYTGFRPAFVLIKVTSTTDEWVIYDTARDTYNVANKRLNPNSNGAEQTSQSIDIVSNGFKPRSTGANINQNAATYIYMAFAENPFKNSNAR